MQLHACMLALATGRPVKMVYGREESFLGHVHRHPAHMEYEHVADRDGRLIAVRLRLILDGGAVRVELDGRHRQRRDARLRALRRAQRADRGDRRVHEQPAERRDARLRRRAGGGRLRGADGSPGRCAGDGSRGAAGPATRCPRAASCRPGRRSAGRSRCRRCSSASWRCPCPRATPDPRALPGGAFRAGRRRRRACGRSATRRGSRTSRSPRATTTRRPRGCGWSGATGGSSATVYTAATEVGQGVLGVQEQIARTELGVADVQRAAGRHADRDGGVGVRVAPDVDRRRRGPGRVPRRRRARSTPSPEGGVVEAERTYRHARTHAIDPVTGQGDSPRRLRVRRAPGRRRRRRRARAGAGRRAGLRAGRRARP